jgi:two-component SAPR family response regulator
MKHMTGCEVANEVNSINPRIKMAFVTSYDNIVNNKLGLEETYQINSNDKTWQKVY